MEETKSTLFMNQIRNKTHAAQPQPSRPATNAPSKEENVKLTIENCEPYRICPFKVAGRSCRPECGLLGLCTDDACNGVCGKVHGNPCPWFFVNKNACNAPRETCTRVLGHSHDSKWESVFQNRVNHLESFLAIME